LKPRTNIFRAGIILVIVVAVIAGGIVVNRISEAQERVKEPSKLLVVWTSGDKDVAIKMVFMYTFNAKKNGWWDDVQLLAWGPSSKLLSTDKELQEYVGRVKQAGVQLTACKACADMYGVSDDLAALGFDVKYMGRPLTDMLNSDWKVVTF